MSVLADSDLQHIYCTINSVVIAMLQNKNLLFETCLSIVKIDECLNIGKIGKANKQADKRIRSFQLNRSVSVDISGY